MNEQKENKLISAIQMPNLADFEPDVISMGSVYWTPEAKGESKRGVVIGIEVQTYERVEESTGEVSFIDLPCVIFAAQNKDLSLTRISNGSKRLVAVIEQALKTGSIIALKTPVVIEYTGKVKNSTNAFKSDSFEVKALKPKQ